MFHSIPSLYHFAFVNSIQLVHIQQANERKATVQKLKMKTRWCVRAICLQVSFPPPASPPSATKAQRDTPTSPSHILPPQPLYALCARCAVSSTRPAGQCKQLEASPIAAAAVRGGGRW